MLVRGFLSVGALQPDEIVVSSRSKGSLDECVTAWPEIGIAPTNADLARRCHTIIIAVEPQGIIPLLHEIGPVMDGDEYIVSLAAGIDLECLEAEFAGSVSRVVPTITSMVCQGLTLICHGHRVSIDDASWIEELFSTIGDVMLIDEDEIPAATLLSSCGPGLLATMIEEMAEAVARVGGLSTDRALSLTTKMVVATATYIEKTDEPPADLIRRVATAGGVTETGVQELREQLPATFDKTFAVMLERYSAIKMR